TTSLLTHMLNTLGYIAKAGGNIGLPVLESLMQLCAEQHASNAVKHPAFLVAEVSSYQLHYTHHATPWACVHTNLKPDHLAWHGGLEAYLAAKTKLFYPLGQKASVWILPETDPLTESLQHLSTLHPIGCSEKSPLWILTPASSSATPPQKTSLPSHRITWHPTHEAALKYHPQGQATSSQSISCKNFQLKGYHNIQNLAQCLAIGYQLGHSPDALQHAFQAFKGVAHRLAPLTPTRHGSGTIHWFNDSKATNPEASQAGLQALASDILSQTIPLFVLVGGHDKGTPLNAWCQDIARLIPQAHPLKGSVILYGEAQHRFIDALKAYTPEVPLHQVETLEEGCHYIVQQVEHYLSTQATSEPFTTYALLSPACASFDQFRSFEHRGEVFEQWVNTLARQQNDV
ncbi:MAG: Mur ligase family protein, partial [Vampirovibrionales bacterium]